MVFNRQELAKQALWAIQKPFHKDDSWPCRVLTGPAKGCQLTLDIRSQGSYWLGTYDSWILNHLKPISHLLMPGGTAWDCGAFVGYYTAIFRAAVGANGFVHTFEASLNNYNKLKHLLALNNWTNVEIHHLAVGPDHCSLDFAGELGGSSGPMGLSKNYDGNPAVETVRCLGLDELIQEYKIPAPSFIKLDLESAEEQALHNGKVLFSTNRLNILLEWHGTKVLPAISDFLVNYSYNAWDILSYHVEESQCGEKLNPFCLHSYAKSGMSNTLLCIPAL